MRSLISPFSVITTASNLSDALIDSGFTGILVVDNGSGVTTPGLFVVPLGATLAGLLGRGLPVGACVVFGAGLEVEDDA